MHQVGESLVTIQYSLEKNQTLASQDSKYINLNNSLEFITINNTELKKIDTENVNMTVEFIESNWIVGEWSKTCKINPCSNNQTRSITCSSDHKKCDNSTKPIESRPCPIQADLVCKIKVNTVFNRVIQFLEELFKSENLIE